MVAKGASAMRIAVAIKRKTSSVRLRARFLGCPLPTLLERRKIMREKAGPSDSDR